MCQQQDPAASSSVHGSSRMELPVAATPSLIEQQETEEEEGQGEEGDAIAPPMLSKTLKWWECQQINNKPDPSDLLHKPPLSNRSPIPNPNPNPNPRPKWGDFNMLSLVWLLAAAGMVVAAMVYHFFSRQHYRQFEDVLATMCDERARMLQHQFAVSINHVHALALLVSTFYLGDTHPPALDQKAFAEYTARTAFERPLMTGVAYAHKVLHSEREEFERKQGWSIKTMHSKETSPVREEYAPTIFSQETIGYLVSLDMMSGEEDHENILRARASGKGALTKPFRLLNSNHLGVVLTYAVYKKDVPPDASVEERVEAASGYLGGAFDVESLVDNLLNRLAKSEDIIVNVFDMTNQSEPLIMYGSDVSQGSTMVHRSLLDFGDPFRRHEMQCRLAREVPYPTLAIGFASSVVAFVALICAMIYNAHMHVRKVEDGYRKMEELKVQAEAADIAKSQFLATVSHEIRTPMNGVLGMLQMLLDTELNAAQQDFARTAQASGKALVTLINEVLDQAKIESGRIELEAMPFDIRAILDDVLSLFSGKTRRKGIELAAFVSERVPRTLIGDPGRIRQIVANLVGNSVKFTERGHIFVCVHLSEDIESVEKDNVEPSDRTAAAGAAASGSASSMTLSGYSVANRRSSWDRFEVLLAHESSKASIPNEAQSSEVRLFVSVEDTGIGIPPEAQKRIFRPFMQVDSSTSRTHGGTGIGLSISNCLVNLMGGQMGFDSIENVGSTFTFTLALRSGHPALLSSIDEQGGSVCLIDAGLPTKLKGMRALVVDGRPLQSQVAKQHLQRLGIRVQTVTDSDVAANLIRDRRKSLSSAAELDMVLVDKDAWGVSTGLDFPLLLAEGQMQRKRKQQQQLARVLARHPKMILIATHLSSSEMERARAVGYADTVIMKPLRASMMGACLEQILMNDGAGPDSGGPSGRAANLRQLLSGRLILVVDDNRINRLVAAGALKKYGAEVECASSARDAIVKLRPPHVFDACFMDIQMPEMDGFEATQKIREMESMVIDDDKGSASSPTCCAEMEGEEEGEGGGGGMEMEKARMVKKRRHVPILAMTADVFQATYDECVRCKMDGFVSKPFEEEQLYNALVHVFDDDDGCKNRERE